MRRGGAYGSLMVWRGFKSGAHDVLSGTGSTKQKYLDLKFVNLLLVHVK